MHLMASGPLPLCILESPFEFFPVSQIVGGDESARLGVLPPPCELP